MDRLMDSAMDNMDRSAGLSSKGPGVLLESVGRAGGGGCHPI